jgi:uncharacterized caspase-like protein
MSIVQAKCPHCGNVLRIPADWLERPMRCKHCKNTFQAKAKGPVDPPPAAAPSSPPPAHHAAPIAHQPTPPMQPAAPPMPHPAWNGAAPEAPAVHPHPFPSQGMPPGYPPPGYAPAGYAPADYAPAGYAPPGYVQPGYPPPGYPPPGYPQQAYGAPPPGYYPPQPAPAAGFGFDESAHDGAEDDSDDTTPRRRPPAAKKSSMVPLVIAGAVVVIGGIALLFLSPMIKDAVGHDPNKPAPPPIVKAKSLSELAKWNRKQLEQNIAEANGKKVAGVNPRPITGANGLPRRALFIAPVNYLFHNATHFYQVREGSGAGENSLLYRFNMGAPFNIEKNQIYVLSDAGDPRYPSTAPQKDVIEAAIKDFVETSRPQDRIIVVFSGHACDIEDKGYLVPIEGDKDEKNSLIPIDWVYEQLAKCKARQKVLVVDAFRFPPARGLELPATGSMTEAVDKQLENPPAGVQVITACTKDQQSLEFENGSLFQSALIDAFRKMALGAIVQPKDSLPLGDLVQRINGFMKENLGGSAMMAKDDKAEAGMAQTCRLSGKETDAGAEPNPAEAAPANVAFLKTDKNDAGLVVAKSILSEIQKFPPMKSSQVSQLSSLSLAALRGSAKEIDEYKDDGFNPFNADAAELSANKDKYPLRMMTYEISTKLKEFVGLPMREVLSNPGGPLDAKAKSRFLLEQKDPALAVLVLEETLADAKKLAEDREKETSKRWQAHFDLALARLQSRLVYIYEYNNLIALIRGDALPELSPTSTGWRINTSAKIQIKEASVKAMAKDASKIWERLSKDYPGTPWAVIAKREKNVSMGLQWVATKD